MIRPRLFKQCERAHRWAALGGIGLGESPAWSMYAPARISEPAGYFRQWLAYAGITFASIDDRGELVERHTLTAEQFGRLAEQATTCENEAAQPLNSTTVVFFTGTREGMTDEQKERVRDLLTFWNVKEAHHGLCVGADNDFNEMVAYYRDATANAYGNLVIYGYPANVPPELAARSRGLCNIVAKAEAPLVRNVSMAERAAVAKIEYERGSRARPVLIACPKEAEKPLGTALGGTWHARRHFLARGIPVYTIYATGCCEPSI